MRGLEMQMSNQDALLWLLRYDNEAAELWARLYFDGVDLRPAARDNLRDFGPVERGQLDLFGGD